MYKSGAKQTSSTASSLRTTGKTLVTGASAAATNKENSKNTKEDTTVRPKSAFEATKVRKRCKFLAMRRPWVVASDSQPLVHVIRFEYD